MDTFNEMTTRSKQAALIIIAKGVKVTQGVAMNVVPQVEVSPGTLEKLDRLQEVWSVKMSTWQRKDALFQQLDLSGMEGWSAQNWAAAHALLSEYHDIFSLEPGEMGCFNLTKHEIKVINDEPFKQRFWRIPPPMVDEVCAYVKEMLEAGAICPSQSPWCNAIIFSVRKMEVCSSASTSTN